MTRAFVEGGGWCMVCVEGCIISVQTYHHTIIISSCMYGGMRHDRCLHLHLLSLAYFAGG